MKAAIVTVYTTVDAVAIIVNTIIDTAYILSSEKLSIYTSFLYSLPQAISLSL